MPESQVSKSDDESAATSDEAVKTKEARATGKKVSAEVKKGAKSSAKGSSGRGAKGKKTPGAKPKKTPRAPGSRRWVPPLFIVVGLLGVAWLITYYVAGQQIPYMSDLGNWNILIGMGGMAAAFVIATFWK